MNNDYISNYSGTTKGKQFLSSTLYIKNNGKLIGMLCCNRDTSIIADLENAIKRTAHQYNLVIRSHDLHENLEERHDSIVADAIAEVIENNGGIAMLKTADKIQVVGELSKKGILTMKGAVSEAARQLHVSVPTVYRYMHK